MQKPKLVIIGNGMAAAKLLQELVATCPVKYDITVFGAEPFSAYNRIMLSPLLAGDKQLDDIITLSKDWYKQHNITLLSGPEHHVTDIKRRNKLVVCKNGLQVNYDKLVIATGSNPFMLPIEGAELKGVMSFRDIADVDAMINATKSKQKAVVIGAGLLGLEAAMGLIMRGMQVTVIHNNDVPLNRQLDHTAGAMLKAELESRRIEFKMNAKTARLIGNAEGEVCNIELDDESIIPADLVVMAIGIRPNIELAQKANLFCRNGIVVSDTLQTFDPAIYALGECVEHRGQTFGLVAPLYDQAQVLANHLAEHGIAQYQTLPMATKLKVTGIQLFSVGEFNPCNEDYVQVYHDQHQGIYKKLVFSHDLLKGVVLYGDTQDGPFYNRLIEEKTNIKPLLPYIMFGEALCLEHTGISNSTVEAA
ncbi:NAD(P)/FAD-dependent oxidoreductase [Bermanella sp. R86510]|uniref:NAD(P)/FAD-dependent oxidoreductase n=1 Tax=unclassified Bermanella TaxID=2627862 RepID=UPI0037C78FC6